MYLDKFWHVLLVTHFHLERLEYVEDIPYKVNKLDRFSIFVQDCQISTVEVHYVTTVHMLNQLKNVIPSHCVTVVK